MNSMGLCRWLSSAGVLLAALSGLAAPAIAQPQAQGKRVVDWHAGADVRLGEGWAMERFGALREANLRLQREGIAEGAAAVARLQSSDDRPPPAQMRYAVPFEPGHLYRVSIELSARSPAEVDVMIRRGKAPYDPMAVRSVSIGPKWQTFTFDGVWPVTADTGDVRVVVRQAQAEVLVRQMSVDDMGPAPFGILPQRPFPPELIGLHVNKLGEHNAWPQAGQGLIRMWDTRTTWSTLAPTLEDFDAFRGEGWKRLEYYMEYVRKNKPDTTVLMTLGIPPRWASDNPDATCAYGVGTCGAPATLELWRHYIKTLATRYKGRIRHWELWNEPDNRIFYQSSQSLVELARVASEVLKAVDPSNILVSPGFTASTGMNGLQNFLRDGGGRYVDVVGYHWYYDGEPEKLAPAIQNVREIMRSNGIGDKPIWNTEGSPLCQGRKVGVCMMNGLATEEQDAVPERAILTMWLNGVQAYAYYTFEGMGDRTIPLLAADKRSPTVAATNLQMFSQWMSGAIAVHISSFGQGGHAVEVQRGSDRFYIVWSEANGQILKLPARWAVSAYQVLGSTRIVLPTSRELSVGRVPVLLSNGS